MVLEPESVWRTSAYELAEVSSLALPLFAVLEGNKSLNTDWISDLSDQLARTCTMNS